MKHAHSSQFLYNSKKRVQQIKEPFSENQILDLQDRFLTPGLHYFSVSSIKKGRSFINMFLSSLNCYHNIACLTVQPDPLETTIYDLYKELLSFGKNGLLEDELLMESYIIDFMWVEATEKLIDFHWFEKKIIALKLYDKIPIMILSCN